MDDRSSPEKTDAELALIEQLVHTALYDTRGESVEGAYVDRWESFAGRAIAELNEIFQRDGFSDEAARHLKRELRKPGVPLGGATLLVDGLRPYVREILEELSLDPSPEVRAIPAVARVYSEKPAGWLRGLEDPSPVVRAAALRELAAARKRGVIAQRHLREALDDPHPEVRRIAADSVLFYRNPEGREALLRRFEIECEPSVRKAILMNLAVEARRAGIHVSGEALEEGIGPEVKKLLIEQLNNDDPEVREKIAMALERFRTPDVVEAMLDRLLVEETESVKFALVRFNGYSVLKERAFPILVNVMKNDPNQGIRVWTAFLFESFGKEGEEPLLEVLRDDKYGVDRSAVMSLGKVGSLLCLPELTRRYGDPTCGWYERELVTAITDVVIRAAHGEPPAWPRDAAQRIERALDASDPEPLRNFPAGALKDMWNALHVWGTGLDHWGLQADGTLLRMNVDAFAMPAEAETDPSTRFAVMVHAAERNPLLAALIPQPPASIRPCRYCCARGWNPDLDGAGTPCVSCSGLGWKARD